MLSMLDPSADARTVMIDWVGAKGLRLTSDRFFNDGYVTKVDADGVVRWRVPTRQVVESSWSTNITISGGGGFVDISGNPSKFLQGHNVFGSADPKRLVVLTMEKLCSLLGVEPTSLDRLSWEKGAYDFHRLDITGMIDCGTSQRVRKLLDVLGQTSRTKHQAPVVRSGTVIYGTRDRRQKLVLYNKGEELKKHPPSAKLAPEWHQPLHVAAEGKLRAELRLGSKWFHENREFRRARWWDADLAATLLDERLADVEVSDTMRLADDAVLNLPPKLVPIYHAWRAGCDLQTVYARRTFYRYRRQLLDLAGIDILHVQPREVVTETQYLGGEAVGPLLRGPRVSVPSWAYGTDLLAS
jgi:II/X family phage/plasmid replication protein